MGDRRSQTPRATYTTSPWSSQYATGPNTARSTSTSAPLDQALSQLSLRQTDGPFDGVQESKYLYLLTPYLNAPPSARLDDGSTTMDPFEPFGRELTRYHTIKHTPYVPRWGLQKTHKAELDDAGGVIVVICQPPSMDHLPATQRLDGLRHQQKVAKAVSKHLEDNLDGEVPGVLICIDADSKQYGFVKGYKVESWSKLNKVVQVIFGNS